MGFYVVVCVMVCVTMADYTLFPSITPDGEAFVDDTYSNAELQEKEYQELREIAAQHESNEVNGRMSREELLAGLEGLPRV